MPEMSELQALTTSIGEYALDVIGRNSVEALQIVMEQIDHVGKVTIALSDNSDEEQKRVLRDLFSIEDVYFDEAALTFTFVDGPDAIREPAGAVPQFSYA
jgi:hypothetical protein